MSILLASELASGGGASDVPLGTVVAQRGDGTVDVSVQGGLMTRVPVVAGARCGVGDVVVVLRRSPSQVVVLGAVRSEPTDDPVRLGIDILWNLLPDGPAASPLAVQAISGSTWHPTRAQWDDAAVAQGRVFAGEAAAMGLWCYGSQLDSLRGATVTGCELDVVREDTGPPVDLWLAGHAHVQRPAGTPTWLTQAVPLGPVGSGQSTVSVPLALAQQLAAGTVRGLGLLAQGPAAKAVFAGGAGAPVSGRLSVEWE